LFIVFWHLTVGANSVLMAFEGCIGSAALIGAGCGALFRDKAAGAFVGASVGTLGTPALLHNFAPWVWLR
jgi:hypothetical protein